MWRGAPAWMRPRSQLLWMALRSIPTGKSDSRAGWTRRATATGLRIRGRSVSHTLASPHVPDDRQNGQRIDREDGEPDKRRQQPLAERKRGVQGALEDRPGIEGRRRRGDGTRKRREVNGHIIVGELAVELVLAPFDLFDVAFHLGQTVLDGKNVTQIRGTREQAQQTLLLGTQIDQARLQ